MTKWPSKKEVESALQELEGSLASRPLSPEANLVDRTKHSLCRQFVRFMIAHRLSQQQLADKLGIDKSLMSKIAHYQFDEFTIDRLIKYLTVLDPDLVVEIKTRVA